MQRITMADDFLYNGRLESEPSSQIAAYDSSNSQPEASSQSAHPDGSDYSTNPPESTNVLLENLQSPELEDLDSYNPIEPPPLDWRSDSSSEAGLAVELESSSVGDFEAPGYFNAELNEDTMSAVSDYAAQDSSDASDKTEGISSQDIFQKQDEQRERKENYAEDRDRNSRNRDIREGKRKEENTKHDIDHSHIQSLLTQLHLFHCETPFDDPAKDSANHSALHNSADGAASSQELEFGVQSADGNIPEALLFSHEYQKDLLQLLEDPEPEEPRTGPPFLHTPLVTPEHPSGLRRQSSDADEMISISHSEDAWHRHLQDELLVSGIAEEDQWTASEELNVDQSVSPNNDLVSF